MFNIEFSWTMKFYQRLSCISTLNITRRNDMFYDNYACKFIKISMIYQVFLFDNFFYKFNYISVKNQYNSKS